MGGILTIFSFKHLAAKKRGVHGMEWQTTETGLGFFISVQAWCLGCMGGLHGMDKAASCVQKVLNLVFTA